MINISIEGNVLVIDGRKVEMPYAIRDAVIVDDKVIVLIDPDAYLSDPAYGKERRRGVNPLHNLVAVSIAGQKLWEAEFPESVGHYYKICSKQPLVAYFTSYKCEIDTKSGRIKKKDFLK